MRRSVIVAAVVVALFAGATACSSGSGSRQGEGNGGTAPGAGGHGPGGVGGDLLTGGTGGVGGGEGGTSGTGGTSGGANGKREAIPISPEQAWLVDPNIWKPLPGEWTEHCRGYVAAKKDLQFPELEWVSCGEGCEKADLLQGFGWHAVAASLTTTIDAKGEVPLLRFVVSGLGDERTLFPLHRLLRLDTGKTLTAVRLSYDRSAPYSPCHTTSKEHAQRLVWGLGNFRPAREVDGVFDLTNEVWNWNLPWFAASEVLPDRGLDCTSLPMDDGRTFYPCIGKIYARITPGSSAVTILDDIGDNRMGVWGSSFGELAAWPELEAPGHTSRIRGWTASGGLQTILSNLPGDTCHVSVDQSHIVGLAYDDSDVRNCWKAMRRPKIWVMRRNDVSLDGIDWSPTLGDGTSYVTQTIATWENRIAAVLLESVRDPNRRRWILISPFPDWETRWLEVPRLRDVTSLALTSTHLYVVLGKLGADVGKVYEVHRYDLSRIEDFTVER